MRVELQLYADNGWVHLLELLSVGAIFYAFYNYDCRLSEFKCNWDFCSLSLSDDSVIRLFLGFSKLLPPQLLVMSRVLWVLIRWHQFDTRAL